MTYVKSQNKITMYFTDHSMYDVPALCLRAAGSLERSGYEDCVYEYGGEITIYAKKNKAGITVRQLID